MLLCADALRQRVKSKSSVFISGFPDLDLDTYA
jgi:hypothetical protein